MSGWCRQREVLVVYIDGDEVGGVQFGGTHVASVQRGNKDRMAGMSSLTNEEPLGVVELSVDVVWEIK